MGVRFGKYVLHARVGAGGMAEVWRATLPGASGVHKPCVVKRIRPELAADPEFVRMFVDEARISISLQHGNLVPILDFGEVDGSYYLAMEYVHGKDLRAVLDETRRRREIVPIEPATLIAIEVCRGLAYAHGKTSPDKHSLGLVHRDVSPSNILLSFEGDVKLSDFGIAKVHSRTRVTMATSLKGKVPYMSPEQASGNRVDSRTDIWAVGVVLYEMLTGRRPFQGADRVATLGLVREGAFQPPRTHRPDLPTDLDEAIRVALAKDPADRFQEARAMQVVLTRFLGRYDSTITSVDLRTHLARLFPEEIEALEPGADPDKTTVDEFDQAVRDAWSMGADRRTMSHRSVPEAEEEAAGAGATSVDSSPEAGTVPETRPSKPEPPVPSVPSVPPAVPSRSRRWLAIPLSLAVGGAVALVIAPSIGLERSEPATAAPPPIAPLALPPLPPAPATVIASPPPTPASAEPEGTSAPERAAPRPTGTLVVNSTPWAQVFVDGRRRAESTPAVVRLPVGRHQVRLVNPEQNVSHAQAVDIRAGETTRVAPRLR